jgi:hypothetical protein
MSEPHVRHTRPWTVARSLGVGVAVAVALSGCGGSSGSGSASIPSVPSVPASTPPISTAAGSTAQQSAGLSGKWTGKYGGTFSGTFTLNWVQTGSKLHGKITLSTSGTVPVNGTVDGSSIKFGTVGSTAVKYTGTTSGDSMSGSYDTPSGGGSWSAHRA